MKKIIKSVIYQPTKIKEGIYASPASFRLDSFRLEMRNFMKHKMPDFYFDKSLLLEPAKNLGCFLFGQKDIWKGVIGINYEIIDEKTNKAKVNIYIEDYRISNEDILNYAIETIEVLLEKMVKETHFTEEIKNS